MHDFLVTVSKVKQSQIAAVAVLPRNDEIASLAMMGGGYVIARSRLCLRRGNLTKVGRFAEE